MPNAITKTFNVYILKRYEIALKSFKMENIYIMLNFIKYYARIIKTALNTMHAYIMHAQEKNLREKHPYKGSKHI